mgnify:FL=1
MAIYINSFALSQGSYSITLSSAVTAYNLRSDVINNHGWDGVEAIEVKLTINSGVLIKSNTSTTALVVDLVSGSTLTLTNNGTIRGHYGSGGTASGGAIGGSGGSGFNAISLSNVSASIINTGEISGGGGGGGASGGTNSAAQEDAEGDCEEFATSTGTAGGRGAGGSFASNVSNGGGLGTAGSAGAAGTNYVHALCRESFAGGSPGAAGKAISVLTGGSRTISNSGSINGANS